MKITLALIFTFDSIFVQSGSIVDGGRASIIKKLIHEKALMRIVISYQKLIFRLKTEYDKW